MHRVAASQADLFALATTAPALPTRGPIAELTDMLSALRAAEHLPWPDAAAAMTEERRALGLARLAGAEGEKLAAAILLETERLLAATDR